METSPGEENELILIGAGGHCRACIDVIDSTSYKVKGIVDPSAKSEDVYSYPLLGNDCFVGENIDKHCTYLIAIGQVGLPVTRKKVYKKISHLPIEFPCILSSMSYVSRSAFVGKGTIVMHYAMINIGARIGEHNIVNSKAVVEHDVSTGNFCHFSTGVIVNGGCKIGNDVFVGSGSIIFNGLTIADEVVIGGGSVVTRNLMEPGTYFGNPARRTQH